MRAQRRRAAGPALALAVFAALVVAFGAVLVSAGGGAVATSVDAVSWRGLVGGPRAPVPSGQRMIVVLTTPSVGQRLAKVRYATEAQERAWGAGASAAQSQVLLKLAAFGVN